MRFRPACRARFLVETLRSPCMSTMSGLEASSCITSVFTTACSGTPRALAGTSVPPCSTYSYSCSVYATLLAFRKIVASVSATGVVLRVQQLHALARHMGVNLRGRNIGVTKQHLHHAQVGAVVDEVRGEGVAQHVRRGVLAGHGARAVTLDVLPERLPRHAGAAAGDVQVVGLALFQDVVPRVLRIPANPVHRLFSKGHE